MQDNILIPDDFSEYICNIWNAFEMHSIIISGLILGGKSVRRDRQSVFFTAVNVVDTQQDRTEVKYDRDKTQNRSVQTQLESSSHHSFLVQFEVCSKKWIAILSHSIACNYSFNRVTSDLDI